MTILILLLAFIAVLFQTLKVSVLLNREQQSNTDYLKTKVFLPALAYSQMQPLYTYSYHQIGGDGSKIYQNEDMGLMKSIHTGLGYEKAFNQGFSIKTEAYYQHLYQVPVTVAPSSFSIINMGSGFARLFPQIH